MDGTLKQYVLNGSVFPKLAPGLQAEIFMTRQGKPLTPAYEKCVKDPDTLGRNILNRLSGKPSAKECNSVASFLTIFSQKASEEIAAPGYRRQQERLQCSFPQFANQGTADIHQCSSCQDI